MSVYVVLDFDDEDEAKEFVIDALHGPFKTRTNYVVAPEVAAVVQKPTAFCHCASRKEGWTRGKNFGWWVHVGCGHPTKGWASLDTWASFMGLNLLPPEISTEMRLQGWERSKFTWEFLLPPNPPQAREQGGLDG